MRAEPPTSGRGLGPLCPPAWAVPSSIIKGSGLHRLKELRLGSRGRSEIRIIFAFDPTRSALLLLGGDKAGNWERWYRDNIPLAERPYIAYTVEEEE
ncbi:type II toxin-antitoxin system RelE/ParE family toxin [Streptosporangium sp. NPDC004631]